jgi:hypothetical protein
MYLSRQVREKTEPIGKFVYVKPLAVGSMSGEDIDPTYLA